MMYCSTTMIDVLECTFSRFITFFNFRFALHFSVYYLARQSADALLSELSAVNCSHTLGLFYISAQLLSLLLK